MLTCSTLNFDEKLEMKTLTVNDVTVALWLQLYLIYGVR